MFIDLEEILHAYIWVGLRFLALKFFRPLPAPQTPDCSSSCLMTSVPWSAFVFLFNPFDALC